MSNFNTNRANSTQTETETPTQTARFSSRAGLVSLALKWQNLDLFGPLKEVLTIPQKTVKYTPISKIQSAFLNILAGSSSMVELNKTVRADQVLYEAFGLPGCAEQSVVQQTLDRSTKENVEQTEQALITLYQRFSRGYFHNYEQRLQLLDVDFTGLPCGPKAALATKGYFAKQRNRRGRQLGRVIATHYHEVLVDQLYPGNVQLNASLQGLLTQAEKVLALYTHAAAPKRKQTVIRADSGGGSVENINWILGRGYLYHGKDYSSRRAGQLMEGVSEWVADPTHPGREVGWITQPHPYQCPDPDRVVRRIAVRCRKANGQWAVGVIVTTLSNRQVIELMSQDAPQQYNPVQVLLAMVYFYDRRGGGIEAEIKEDKQALGLGKRNKKSFEAQQMLVLLGTLAHNVIVWSQKFMQPTSQPTAHTRKDQPPSANFEQYGLYRLMRDVFTMNGLIFSNAAGQITQIVLNSLDPFAKNWFKALNNLLLDTQVVLNLGQT